MSLKNFLSRRVSIEEGERVAKEVQGLESRLSSVGEQPRKRPLWSMPLLAVLSGLQRTQAMANNVLSEFMAPGLGSTPGKFDPLQAAWRGLKLEDTIQGKDIVSSMGLSDNPWFEANLGSFKIAPNLAGIAGLAVDALNPLDPVNWIGGGIAKSAAKKLPGDVLLTKAFGRDAAEELLEKLGVEWVEKLGDKMVRPTVGQLIEKISRKANQLGIQEGVNPQTIVDIMQAGLNVTGRGANDVLTQPVKTALTFNLRNALMNPLSKNKSNIIKSYKIPGSEALMDILGEAASKLGSTKAGQALGRSFSTRFVPKEVPDSVFTRFIHRHAQKIPGEASQVVDDIAKLTGQAGEEALGAVSGPEAYKELTKGLQRMMERSRVNEQIFQERLKKLFAGTTDQQRKEVLQAAIDPAYKLSEKLIPIRDEFIKWRSEIAETYQKLGIDFTPIEHYVPFIPVGRPLTKDEAAMLKGLFGTSVKTTDAEDIMSLITKFDPNLKTRTTKALNPAEINRVLGREWLTEDAGVAMARRGIRAIRGQEAITFLGGMAEKYGLTIDDIGELKNLPTGYVLVQPTTELSGRISLSATDVLKGKAMALPQEFVKAYNDYTDLLFNTGAMNTFTKYWDDATRVYKMMAYMWNPGHIPRDLGSNTYNLWLAGVRDPRRYADAIEALFNPQKLFDFPQWKGSAEELNKVLRNLGLLDSGTVLADFMQAGKDITFKMGGAYTEALRKATRGVDNFSRLVGVIDRLTKGETPEQAVAHVKKYLFDYFDLTAFEKRYMKRIVPFYTWMRKNIPLQVKTLLEEPGKLATAGKIMRSVGEFPEEEDVPEFIYESGGFKLPGPQGGTYVIPNLPFTDLAKIPTGLETGRELIASVNPLARIPLEMLSNTSLYSGLPLERYAGEQEKLPFADLLARLGVELPTVPSRSVGYLLDQIPPLRNLSVITNPDNPRQAARLTSVLGGPQFYPADWAAEAASYERRDEIRDLIRYLQAKGVEVPTQAELRKISKKRGLVGFIQRRGK